MKNHLQQAEALFAGLGKPKPAPAPPKSDRPKRRTAPASGNDRDGEGASAAPRRRRIVPGATVSPKPIQVPEVSREDGQAERARFADAIRALGLPAASRDKRVDAPDAAVPPAAVETGRTPRSVEPIELAPAPAADPAPRPPSPVVVLPVVPGPRAAAGATYLVRVQAPTIREDDLCFVLEGDDVAGVTTRAMAEVAGYMVAEHGGAAWNMRSVERITNVLHA